MKCIHNSFITPDYSFPILNSYFNLQIPCINVIRHEKTMLMHPKYTSLHYFNYLTFCVNYTSSVNYIGFPIFNYTIRKKSRKLLNFVFTHVSTVYPCQVTNNKSLLKLFYPAMTIGSYVHILIQCLLLNQHLATQLPSHYGYDTNSFMQ